MPDNANGQERVKKAYARLRGLKEGLPRPKSDYVDSTQAKDFNKAIDHLVGEGFDVDEFRIQDDEIMGLIVGGDGVLYNTLITRLNAVLVYFTVKETGGTDPEDPPTRKIGFEGPRQT